MTWQRGIQYDILAKITREWDNSRCVLSFDKSLFGIGPRCPPLTLARDWQGPGLAMVYTRLRNKVTCGIAPRIESPGYVE